MYIIYAEEVQNFLQMKNIIGHLQTDRKPVVGQYMYFEVKNNLCVLY